MAKAGVKDILLRKGEKIAVGIGVGLLGLLGLMGLMNVVGAESPTQKIDKFQKEDQRIRQGVSAKGAEAEKLPDWVLKQLKPPPIEADTFAAADTTFEPIHQPDFLRENPRVLGIIAYQIEMLRAPMPALDVQEGPDGIRIGVLANRPAGKQGKGETYRALKDALSFRNKKGKERTPPRGRPGTGGTPSGGMPGGMPGGVPGGLPGGGMPGGMAGGMPGRGGMPGGMPGRGGMPGGMPGGMGGGMPGAGEGMGEGFNPYGMMGGMGGMMGGQRDDRSVEYLTPEDVQKKGLPLAQTVYPLKAVLVQAVVPVKLQTAENRKALRMPEHKAATTFGGMPMPGGMPGGLPGGITPGGIGRPGGPGAPGGMMPGEGSPDGMPGGLPGTMPGGMPGGLGSAGGAYYMNSPYPVYDGFEVERRILPPGATEWSDWTFYDHENEYFTKIRARKWADDPYQGQGYLSYFLRPYTERMWAPLPQLADDLASWPALTMPPILENIKKLEEANKPQFTPTDWQKRFQEKAGTENPYAPLGSGTYGAGYGPEGGMPGMMPGQGQPGPGVGGQPPVGEGGDLRRGGRFPGAGPGGAGTPGMPGEYGMPGSYAQMPEVEYTLLRFLDVDPRPGYSYQYRIRVKMKNPNHNQPDKVSRKSDAKVETLYGPWAQLEEVVTVPPESFVYAADAEEYVHHVDDLFKQYGRELALRNVMEYRQVQEGRRAVVQFQSWMPQIRIDGSGNKTEPIGTWVVADMPAAPGDFIGRRQLVELPLWSASQQAYVLRELSGGAKVHGLVNQKNQPKGWPVNFQTLSVLVDFEGGKTKAELADRTITDDSATEVLILRPDGKLLVRNSVADKEDPDKKGRQETWDKWLERVKQRKEMNMMITPMDPGGGFERGGGKGGPGS